MLACKIFAVRFGKQEPLSIAACCMYHQLFDATYCLRGSAECPSPVDLALLPLWMFSRLSNEALDAAIGAVLAHHGVEG